MLIGKVSEIFTLPIDTLRYYDKIGLLTPKRKNNQRYYSENDLKKLKLIIIMKKMMFTLEEIKDILQADEKIDIALENDSLDIDSIELLLNSILIKYKEILDMEENIKKVKKHLKILINKIEKFKEGGITYE